MNLVFIFVAKLRALVRVLLMAVVAGGIGILPLSAVTRPGVGFEQKIGATIPLDLPFRDTSGNEQPLGHWFRGKPVVLWFGYASCPQLCSVVSDGMVATLRQLQPSVGRDYDVVMVSIDDHETASIAQAERTKNVSRYGRTGAEDGWSYLSGGAAEIRALTEAAGFHFVYDERSRQYAHPSGFLVLTPRAKVSAYFIGVDFAPKDVAAALTRAGQNGLSQRVEDLLLICFRGDGIAGRYGRLIWRTLGFAVVATVVGLASWIGRMLAQEQRALRQRKGQRT